MRSRPSFGRVYPSGLRSFSAAAGTVGAGDAGSRLRPEREGFLRNLRRKPNHARQRCTDLRTIKCCGPSACPTTRQLKRTMMSNDNDEFSSLIHNVQQARHNKGKQSDLF
jgi:hypothetical protein